MKLQINNAKETIKDSLHETSKTTKRLAPLSQLNKPLHMYCF